MIEYRIQPHYNESQMLFTLKSRSRVVSILALFSPHKVQTRPGKQSILGWTSRAVGRFELQGDNHVRIASKSNFKTSVFRSFYICIVKATTDP